MRRLLLLSNSRNPGGEYLAHARGWIRGFLGIRRRVVFVPWAAVTVDADAYTRMLAACLEPDGIEVVGVDATGDGRRALRDADAVVVGGGNTFALLARLRQTGAIEAIRDAVSAGALYIGWSAGSNVACPTIGTTNDMPIVHPGPFDALGLVPFQINPHYTEARIPNHGGESRDDRIAEYLVLNPRATVVGLREGSALRVEDGRVELLGPHPARIFRAGTDAVEAPPGELALAQA